MAENLIDVPESWKTLSREVKATGRVENFVEDVIEVPAGGTVTRQWTTHLGAVAVIAMDEQQRIAVVHQYRHPVGFRLVEPPAGLLDHPGEVAIAAAKRELAEEALLEADRWDTLVDLLSSPGGNQESIRVFLARELRPAPRPEGFVVEGEEIDMGQYWVPLDELVDKAFNGEIQSPTIVNGVLALKLAIAQGRLDNLRPADAPWAARAAKLARDAEF